MVQNIKKSYHKIANPNNPMPLSPFKKETRDTHTYFNSAQVQNSGSHLENKQQHALKQQHQHGIAT